MASRNNEITRITALYERLSRDDDQNGDSLSISNQKAYLEDYAVKNGFRNIRHYTDDGYTGRNFNRPGFQEMLKDIENDLIGTVIVKDMSRFGRNYLQVGFYTEMMFPKKLVRFIAINNNVDSNNPSENDFAPFLNIMNEWYAKDTSNKIKTIFLSRMKEGKRCSGSIPYGYNRLPGDKQKLVVDPVASEVVKRVFNMAADDLGPTDIARRLTEEKVLIPTAYTKIYHPEQCNQRRVKDIYSWHPSTIAAMLQRQEYLGHTVLRKSIGTDFKTDSRRAAEHDEQFLFLNTHEAIIDQETWDRVRSSYKRNPRKNKPGRFSEYDRYGGLLFCADCGAKLVMQIHYDKNKTPIFSYRCSNYHKSWTQTDSCTSHTIAQKDLDAIVGTAVRRIIWYVLEDEEAFASRLIARWTEQENTELDRKKNELNKSEKRFYELSSMIQKLYLDFSNDLLPERQYRILIKNYDNEQNSLESKIQELSSEIRQEEKKPAHTDKFLEIVKRYKQQDYLSLSKSLLRDLINRIEIHQAEGGKTKQRRVAVDIYFKFIGDCALDPTPQELIEQEEKMKELERINEEKREKERRKRAERRKENLYKKEKKLIRKTCETCGKEFFTSRSRQKNCSKECSYRAKEKRSLEYHRNKVQQLCEMNGGHRYPERNCSVCGKPFWPTTSRNTICSKECENKKMLERYYKRKEKRKQEVNKA